LQANGLCSRGKTPPHQYVKLIANGEVDEILLDAIEEYVKTQKKRLGRNGEAAN
jgi:hypothetical protein